jgi:methionyl-tRNA formyltransferase
LILHRSSHTPANPGTALSGTILEAEGNRIVVATGDGALDLLMVQAEGKRPMAARDFLAGHPLVPGDRFTMGV